MSLLRHGLVLLAVACSSCGRVQQTHDADTWIGSVHDGEDELSVALAVQGNSAAFFACGNDPLHENYPGWFVGPTDGDRISLSRKGWSVTATWTAANAQGTFTSPSGAVTHWTASIVRDGEPTGVYAAADSGSTTGVIVSSLDGSPVVRGAWFDAFG